MSGHVPVERERCRRAEHLPNLHLEQHVGRFRGAQLCNSVSRRQKVAKRRCVFLHRIFALIGTATIMRDTLLTHLNRARGQWQRHIGRRIFVICVMLKLFRRGRGCNEYDGGEAAASALQLLHFCTQYTDASDTALRGRAHGQPRAGGQQKHLRCHRPFAVLHPNPAEHSGDGACLSTSTHWHTVIGACLSTSTHWHTVTLRSRTFVISSRGSKR
jgi:hypothetical protein